MRNFMSLLVLANKEMGEKNKATKSYLTFSYRWGMFSYTQYCILLIKQIMLCI